MPTHTRERLLTGLPNHLAERTRFYQTDSSSAPSCEGEFVVYWMQTAVRSDENPALDVAAELANRFEIPLLVYQGLSPRYRFASDRHHTFILQGARDVQRAFSRQGIAYALNVETGDSAERCLKTLADAAAVVVTEDMPVDPPRKFVRALGRQTHTPILCVDTVCVVPMQLVSESYTRAFEFRRATKSMFESRVTEHWPVNENRPKMFAMDGLPFANLNLNLNLNLDLDLDQQSIASIVARCRIDHSVGPVPDTVGGEIAGGQRWEAFRDTSLSRYASRRNDALATEGVSRMSAYLRYGMVSPMRIAREAAEMKSAGSEKFLDELLIWREMSYNFCFHRSDHGRWSSIPQWAQETLREHQSDVREDVYSWETLARGQTDSPLWNAAQKSLLINGELHNNVRMTWGKAILNWTADPKVALKLMIDLNHRYALDGRDPNSYGGLLWCLGQFDRPFEPPQPIFGTVRTRPVDNHARRLDVGQWADKVAVSRLKTLPRVAVIGSGISGAIAARTLSDHGVPVTVFDKGRGVGGRMATRRVDGESCFDHGAQYFTARDPVFQRYVDSWLQDDIVASWPDKRQRIVSLRDGEVESTSKTTRRFVATPTMTAIVKHLCQGIDLQTGTRIASIEPDDRTMRLTADDGRVVGVFDNVIVATPSEQAADLVAPFPKLALAAGAISMQPCYALMLTVAEPITTDWVGAFVDDEIISWIGRNSTKPARPGDKEHLVVHANSAWTTRHWDDDRDSVAAALTAALWRVTSLEPQPELHRDCHRWKFARCDDASTDGYFCNPDHRIVVCGDWANGSRVEGAFLSGISAAGRLMAHFAMGD